MAPPKLEPATRPLPLLLSLQHLVATRQRLAQGDARLQPALDRLLHRAEISRRAGPFSVMEKHRLPPSGDKHDYLSLATYFWPDPDAPNGLPYLERDGQRNPEGDDYDQPALQGLCDAVSALALAYQLTGRDDYARHAGSLARIWFLEDATHMNPHLRFAQFVPGQCDGRMYGIIDASTRIPSLLDAIALLHGSLGWDDDDHAKLLAWMKQLLHWLLTGDFGQAIAAYDNNHAVYYDILTARLALFVGQHDTARDILAALPARRLGQIAPDGRMPRELRRTRALSYSVMNLKGFFDLATLGDHLGLNLWEARGPESGGIRAALDWLTPYLQRPLRFPYPQIVPFDYSQFVPLLRRAALAYREPTYEQLIGKLADVNATTHLAQLLYPAPLPDRS